jgi:hypothetical protein
MGDDPGGVFHDVAVAIDYSGSELTGHCVPPSKIVIALTLFINLIIQIYIALQGIDMIDIGKLGVLVPSFENRGVEGLRSVQAEPLE